MTEIRPQPGYQEAILSCRADIAIGGGAAGAGKSFALVLDPLRWVHAPHFRGVLFRRTFQDIKGSDGLWDTAYPIYSALGARMNSSELYAEWPSGARIEFRHLQHEKDRHSHQGRAYAFIGFDELTLFTERQFWYLLSRLRSVSGVRPYVRATCNPDPDSFVARLISWWIGPDGYPLKDRAGVIRYLSRSGNDHVWGGTAEELTGAGGPDPVSVTFVPGLLEDNKILMDANPEYARVLAAQPYVDRMRLQRGNWLVRESAGLLFRAEFFRVVERPRNLVQVVRAWDLAATEPSASTPDPDWTRGVKLGKTAEGDLVILDVASIRGRPAAVERLLRETAEADEEEHGAVRVGLWQDPGQAGKAQASHLVSGPLSGFSVEVTTARENKLTYAKPVSAHAERIGLGMVEAPWNQVLTNEAEAFPEGRHDDAIDALSLAFRMVTRSAPIVNLDPGALRSG